MVSQQSPPFGALLKTLRAAAGLTQEALAERAGLSVRGLQDLERGRSQKPHRDTVALLAAALRLADSDRTLFVADAPAQPLSAGHPVAVALPPLFAAGTLVPLVGRADEFALLERCLAGDGEPLGAPPVLVLAGDPGMGKTRLLQAAAQQAIAQGWAVLVGGCHRRGGQEPYAPVLDALAQHLQAAGPDHRRAALAGCAWLVRLLPEFAEALEPLPAGNLAAEQERRLVFAAVARLLTNVAGPAGTLLVLDDLQWAGADALDLLATLLRTSTLPLRMVGAYRDTEARPTDPLGVLLADLAQARLLRQHTLSPLAPQEAVALLDDLLVDLAPGDRGQVQAVLQRAGGTPFFLVSYAQALHQGSAATLPWDIAQGVRQRVALLPPSGQELLGVAAVVGRHVARALLVAVVGQPEEAVLAAVEAACRARLLVEEGEHGYVFAHDVIREVVEADLGAARRAVLHRKVAEALEGDQVGASPETLAHHYTRSDTPDKAVRYLELAGDHAWAQRAHAAAESHYRAVLDRRHTVGHAQAAARVREKLGDVLYQRGSYDATLQVLEPAAEAYRAVGDGTSLGRVVARIGWAQARRGTPRDGIARLTEVLAALEHGAAAPSVAALHAALAQLWFTSGQYEATLAASERAAALARAAGDDQTRVLAEGQRANILQTLGRVGEALRVSQDLLPLAEAAGDLDGLLRAHRDLAYISTIRGAFATSREALARALRVATQLGDPAQRAFTLTLRGWIALLSGDWPAAWTDLDCALALSRQVERSWYAPYPLLFRGRLWLVEGDKDAADAAVAASLALAEDTGDLQARRWASAVGAESDILAGRPEAARARLVPLLDRPGMQECDVTTLLPVLAWAQLELGQVDLAADTVEQSLRRARPEEMRLVLVEALRVQAMIAVCRGQYGSATQSVEEGLELARRLPYPYAEGRLLYVAGGLHAAAGAPEVARERWEAALACFTRLGARADMARTAQALRLLSGPPVLVAAEHRAPPALAPPVRVAAGAQGRRRARTERQAWALSRLRTDGALSPGAYATALGVSVDTALRDLRELTQRGALTAQGTTKDRRYVLRPAAAQGQC